MTKRIRCAVYTRKSTEEGLDKDLTSLDVQRESAESYIASQKHEGWILLGKQYNDGGFTGANMERPALKDLLNDVKEGHIDCVVVYKVDRLSRSLLDFTRILEFFDKHQVTFVSVTQHFNTENSMGRLTLNILLSFAQFEREMISERTRDKMGAARKRGQWTGGRPPLGYDVDKENHSLIINKEESEVIQKIFQTYLTEQSIQSTAQIIDKKGYKGKTYVSRKGRIHEGQSLLKNQIHYILKNPVYIGKVKYRDHIYDGQHEAIIAESLFNNVQSILQRDASLGCKTIHAENIGLLSQLVRCKACNTPMFYTYTSKKNRKYRYYVCHSAQKKGYPSCPNPSLSAKKLEDIIIDYFKKAAIKEDRSGFVRLIKQIMSLWDELFPAKKREMFKTIIEQITIDRSKNEITLFLNRKGIETLFQQFFPDEQFSLVQDELVQTFKLNIESDDKQCLNEQQEVKPVYNVKDYLLLAYQIDDYIQQRKLKNFDELAKRFQINRSRISQIMNLLLLSPSIQTQILTQNLEGITERKLRSIALEPDWKDQEKLWKSLVA